ncbi:MAG TPA: phosphatidylserine/phosphatidylglycerophosphate/cardiolipin synthase family protein [Thermoanaerobaculia bacterium]|nr:phosphatidylserine/phosphatidylglycerophosphate/cardiolipin synthase family protein [Thermoanaerobaculia bacterium]
MHRRALALALLLLLAATARADVVRILADDREAAQARVDLIRQAQDSIEVLYFMAKDDKVALGILQLLRDARRRGVRDVRVVIDGSFRRIPKAVMTHLRDEGVLIRTYHPFDLRHPTWMLHRMHEKVILVDGKRYITGGRNLAESYFGLGRDMNYRDVDIYVDGPSAADAHQRFETVWNSRDVAALHGHVTGSTKREAAQHLGDALAEMTKSGIIDLGATRDWSKGALDVGPMRFLAGHDVGSDMAALIAGAKQSVVIESPYFIPPRFFRELLHKKLSEGVRIVVVTNSVRSTDGLLPQIGYLKYRDEFARAGIDFREYKGPDCLHGKVILVDGRVVMIGSYNVDPRSQYLNTEITCVAENEELARALQQLIDGHIENAWTIQDAPHAAPVKAWAFRMLLPILEHQL